MHSREKERGEGGGSTAKRAVPVNKYRRNKVEKKLRAVEKVGKDRWPIKPNESNSRN